MVPEILHTQLPLQAKHQTLYVELHMDVVFLADVADRADGRIDMPSMFFASIRMAPNLVLLRTLPFPTVVATSREPIQEGTEVTSD